MPEASMAYTLRAPAYTIHKSLVHSSKLYLYAVTAWPQRNLVIRTKTQGTFVIYIKARETGDLH